MPRFLRPVVGRLAMGHARWGRWRHVGMLLTVGLLLAALGALVEAETPTREQDGRFGLVLVPPQAEWLTRATEAGARANRYQLNWWDVAPWHGAENFGPAEADVAAMHKAGLEVTMLVTAPPEWARRHDSRWVPSGLEHPWDAPENVWGHFVYTTVTRFKGQVRFYEFFNEPDNPQFWDASPADYARLLAVAYQATRAADPDARVVMAGFAHWTHPEFAEQVLLALREMPDAAANGFFFDVAAWHWYSRADQLYDRVIWARELLARYGMEGKAIWINETNIPLWGDGPGPQGPTWGFGSPTEQAAFIVQAYTNAFAAGAERVFVFRLQDNAMDETFGLMRDDGSARPGYAAYQAVNRWLAGSRFVTREQRGDAVLTVFRRAPDEKITVVWSVGASPTTLLVNSVAPEAKLVNVLGESQPITPDGGLYRLELEQGARYARPVDGQEEQLVAGPPLFLIERDETPPIATLQPLPALSPQAPVTLRWSGESPAEVPIARYELQLQTDDGPWQPWRTTTATELRFDGQPGHRYRFRVRAVDANGRASEWPPAEQPMAETSIGGAMVGTLYDGRNRPVVGLRLCVVGTTRCTETDHAGFFRLSPLPGGLKVLRGASGDAQVMATRLITAGQEVDAGLLRLLPEGNAIQAGDMGRLDRGWQVEPQGAATVRDGTPTGGPTVLRLQPGGRLRQRVHIPASGSPALLVRYRIPVGESTFWLRLGVPLGGTVAFDPQHEPLTLVNDVATDGEWQEIIFDLYDFGGREMLVELGAGGSGTPVEVDEVYLGATEIRWHVRLPLLMREGRLPAPLPRRALADRSHSLPR